MSDQLSKRHLGKRAQSQVCQAEVLAGGHLAGDRDAEDARGAGCPDAVERVLERDRLRRRCLQPAKTLEVQRRVGGGFGGATSSRQTMAAQADGPIDKRCRCSSTHFRVELEAIPTFSSS